MNDFDNLARLPGQEQEQTWIRERLETLSIREAVALSAASQYRPPESAADAINLLQSLDEYEVSPDRDGFAALGRAYLLCETKMPESALPFVDLEQTGQWYADNHPGTFVGNCYVEYPKQDPAPAYRPGFPLPEDDVWSVKMKIASDAVPEGVWLRLPGYFLDGCEETVDEVLALQALQVRYGDECTLLDARCILPEAGDLMAQYDDAGELSYDGTELGYVLGEHGQGSQTFMERYAAALELEHCRNLKLALDISQNLKCYDWTSCADLAASAERRLQSIGISEELILATGIDLAGYEAHLLEQDGYMLTADESAYIKRNNLEFRHIFSSPTPEQSGPVMQ